MSSIQEDFSALRERLRQTSSTSATGDKPLYYLVFTPEELLEAKRSRSVWLASLTNDGWDVSEFSIFRFVREHFQRRPLMRNIWLRQDKLHPLEWEGTNTTLANELSHGELSDALITRLSELMGRDRALLLITDLEALHPYTRFGLVEAQLYGHVQIPTVVLYPGTRAGDSSLSFLGFYPDDGNYRSIHVGGALTQRNQP